MCRQTEPEYLKVFEEGADSILKVLKDVSVEIKDGVVLVKG